MTTTLAALAHRDYQLLWIGFVISNFGSQMQVFALGWSIAMIAIRPMALEAPIRGTLLRGIVGGLVSLFAAQRGLPSALLMVALLSLAGSAQIGLHIAAYQSTAPDEVRGRVTAVSSSMVQSCTAVGALVLGAAGIAVGLDVALAFGGAIVLLAALKGLRTSAFRSWEREIATMPVQI